MDRKESGRLTFNMAVFCLAFTALLCMLYFLFLIAQPHRKDEIRQADVLKAEQPQVILDAGHGGRDGGAKGVTGLVEKELNLEIACILHDMLTVSGINTGMTRRTDSLVCDESDPKLQGKRKQADLKNRVAFADANPQALFVSIHMNNFSVEKYSGLQVYYSPRVEKSRMLAMCIQENTVALLQPGNTRQIKAAGNNIFLLDRIRSTAVLVECGFLSNYAESERLADTVYQKQLALVLAVSILQNLPGSP